MKKILLNKNIQLNSDKKAISFVEPMVHQIVDIVSLPMDKYYNILIAVTEAVNNAIIHGNRFDNDKKVTLSLIVTDENITVEVLDQGNGFDPAKVADPRETENLLKENGRGVFLIKELTTDCDISSGIGGTRVKMIFDFD